MSSDGNSCVAACTGAAGAYVKQNSNQCVESCGGENGRYIVNGTNDCTDTCWEGYVINLDETRCILSSNCNIEHAEVVNGKCQCASGFAESGDRCVAVIECASDQVTSD